MFNFYCKKDQLKVLRGLDAKPYKFYRGKNFEPISDGRYFCSCFDIAKQYRLYDDSPIIETEIAIRNPLIIDATCENGYYDYNNLHVFDCNLYPQEKRKDLIKYSKRMGRVGILSTDEILNWAKSKKNIDSVIIKNVREGSNNHLPIYDVMIWNDENLINTRNVVHITNEYDIFRNNTFKRINLSAYILEKEEDGVIQIIEENGYLIKHIIKRDNKEWYIEQELVINTDIPIKILCLETNSYVTAEKIDLGIYQNTEGITSMTEFVPYNNCVRVQGMRLNLKYKIEI